MPLELRKADYFGNLSDGTEFTRLLDPRVWVKDLPRGDKKGNAYVKDSPTERDQIQEGEGVFTPS